MTTRSWHESQLPNNLTHHDSTMSHMAETHLLPLSKFKNTLFKKDNEADLCRQKATLTDANDACTYGSSDFVKEKCYSKSSSSNSSYARSGNRSYYVTRRRYRNSSSRGNSVSQSATFYESANEKTYSVATTPSDESSDSSVYENLFSNFSKSQESFDEKLQESLSCPRKKPFQHHFHKWLNSMMSRNADIADWCTSKETRNLSESDNTTDDHFQTNHAKIQTIFCDNTLITNRIDEMFTRLQDNIRSSLSRLQQFKTEISCTMDELGHRLKDCEVSFTRDKQKFNASMDEEINDFIMSGWARSGHLGFIDISELFEPVLKNKIKRVEQSRILRKKDTQQNKDHDRNLQKNSLLPGNKVKALKFSKLFPKSCSITLSFTHPFHQFKCCDFPRETTRDSLESQNPYVPHSSRVKKHRKTDKLNKLICENNPFKSSSNLTPYPQNFLVTNAQYYSKDVEGQSENEKAILFLSKLHDKVSTDGQSDSSSECFSNKNCLSSYSTSSSLLNSEDLEENQTGNKNAWIGEISHCARQTLNCMCFLAKSNEKEFPKECINEFSKKYCKTNQLSFNAYEKRLPGKLSTQTSKPPCEPKYNIKINYTKDSSKQYCRRSSKVFLYDSENSDDDWIKTSPAELELKLLNEKNEEQATSTGRTKQKEPKFFFKSCTLLQEILSCSQSNQIACATERMYTTTFVIGNMDRKANILVEIVQNICNTSLQDSFVNEAYSAQDVASDLIIDKSIQHTTKPTICHAGFTRLSQHHVGCVPARVTEFWQLADDVLQDQAVWIFRGRLITPLKNTS